MPHRTAICPQGGHVFDETHPCSLRAPGQLSFAVARWRAGGARGRVRQPCRSPSPQSAAAQADTCRGYLTPDTSGGRLRRRADRRWLRRVQRESDGGSSADPVRAPAAEHGIRSGPCNPARFWQKAPSLPLEPVRSGLKRVSASPPAGRRGTRSRSQPGKMERSTFNRWGTSPSSASATKRRRRAVPQRADSPRPGITRGRLRLR